MNMDSYLCKDESAIVIRSFILFILWYLFMLRVDCILATSSFSKEFRKFRVKMSKQGANRNNFLTSERIEKQNTLLYVNDEISSPCYSISKIIYRFVDPVRPQAFVKEKCACVCMLFANCPLCLFSIIMM
jgi:hypothetical protein